MVTSARPLLLAWLALAASGPRSLSQEWRPGAAPPPGLEARGSHAMAYDSARRVVVLFGGAQGTDALADTWEYDGAAWSPGAAAPPQLAGRLGHGMAFDDLRNLVVIFGGKGRPHGFPVKLNDAWEYDGAAWMPGGAAPPQLVPRQDHAMAWNDDLGRIAVFGGLGESQLLADTWEYDGAWRAGAPAPLGLSPRASSGFAHDQARGVTVLFGGWDGSTPYLDDTWEYDGTSWSPGAVAPPGLTPRSCALAYDAGRRRVVMFGGRSQAGTLAETWELDGTSWAAGAASPPALTPRYDHAMAADMVRSAIVLFGGIAPPLDDTWEYACVAVSPPTLPGGIILRAYSQTITASGGTAPHTFTVTSGTLPPGLVLDGASGLVSGTPTSRGTFSVVVTASEAGGCEGSRGYALTIGCPDIDLAPPSLHDGTTGVAYLDSLVATGGTPPYAFALTAGALPPGLALGSSDGRIQGIPAASGTFSFDATATDVSGCDASRAYVMRIAAATDHVVGEGHGSSSGNGVRVYTREGSATGVNFQAYGAGAWGTSVTCGDVDGGEHEEIVTGPGPGPSHGPHVRGFDRSGLPLPRVSYHAYGTLKFGVNPGAGDIEADGYDELITGPGAGLVFGPHIRAWDVDGSQVTPIVQVSFYAFSTLRWGAGVGAGDVDADGYEELLTTPGPGPVFGPTIRGWDYDGLVLAALSTLRFDAFPTPGYGAGAAAGDADDDGRAEIAAAPGPGPALPSWFRGFDYDGATVMPLPGFDVVTFPSTSHGGRVALGDLAADGRADLIAGAGRDPAATSTVEAYGYDGTALAPLQGFLPFQGSGFGVNVAGGMLGYY